jgi:hypothetical protein
MAGKRPKSPNFPAFGLKDAVDKVSKIFEQEGKSRINPASAVKALDYSSLNGASLRVLGALRQYGLLEGVNDDVKVSDLAIKILHGEESERLGLLREAGRRPRIFHELLQEHGSDLPSDESLKARLLTKMNFSTPEAAQLCVQAFRETVNLAKLIDNDYINAKTDEGERIRKEKEEQDRNSFSGFLGAFSQKPDGVKKEMSTTANRQQPFVKMWSLTGGAAAKLEINSIPSKKDQEFLKLCLDRALEELKEIEENKPAGE